MPIDIKPISGSWSGNPETLTPEFPTRTSNDPLPSSYSWLRSQGWDYDRYLVGQSPFRVNSVGGGFSGNIFQQLAHAEQNATVPDPPALDVPQLYGNGTRRVGQLTLDMLDPLATVAELTGSYVGLDKPVVGPGGAFDPMAFLSEKGIDLFGAGETGAPARLSDYVVAPFIAAGQMVTGQPMPDDIHPDMPYSFQQDPVYWDLVRKADESTIKNLAYATVNRVSDARTNPWLVEQLTQQMLRDRDRAAALASGDAGMDYIAIKSAFASRDWYAQTGQLLGDGGLSAAKFESPLMATASWIPFIGWNVAEGVDPITPEERAFWQGLSPEIRAGQFGKLGLIKAGLDIASSLPALSGIGAAAAIAKGAGGAAGAAYKTYDGLLKLSKITMATGLTAATTTWALEAAWPADLNLGPVTGEGVKEWTRRVDLSRPFSQSDFAGAINAVGFWSSATFGAATVVQAGRKALRAAGRGAAIVADATGVPRPTFGMPDLRMYAAGLGGSDMARFAARDLGLDPQGLRLSAQRLWLSETLNSIRRSRLARWSAVLAGHETGTFVDDLPLEARIELANADLARPMEASMGEAEAIARTMRLAREEMPILSDDAIRAHRIARRNARSWDDALARGFVHDYGAPFMQRLAGADTPEALRTWIAGALDRLGGVADALPAAGSKSLEWWHQLTRTVYHYGFDRWAGVIAHAGEGAEEGARVTVMSQRHVFRNDVDEALAILRDPNHPGHREMYDRLMTKIEAEDWALERTQTAARQGKEWAPSPAALADHLEDIRPTLAQRRELPSIDGPTSTDPLNLAHREMRDEGLWDLGYKPVDEAGNFISSVETRTGQTVQTRWLDYPLSSQAAVELGNRSFLANKMDAVTRGFRTWRLVELQRSSLFRSLSGRTDFTATQIEAFHEGVLALSRKHAISPQAVGRAPDWAPGLRSMGEEVNALAKSVFGPGPHLDVNGKAIDWRREIGNAYRQAYRLNLTAGLTSHLKASFGPIGESITYLSDFAYVMWRFGLSPLFKGGELWESAQLNLMRRVDPFGDPWTDSLYVRSGAAGDPGVLASELTGDQMAAGLERPHAGQAGRTDWSSDERAAAGLSWYARQLPEDHAQQLARAAAAERAQQMREFMLGGEVVRGVNTDGLAAELIDLTDEAGAVLPGNEARVAEIVRILDQESLPPHIKEALAAWPEGAPTAAQIARAQDLRETAAAWREMATGKPAGMPDWLYEEMVARGQDPARLFNDVDLADPAVREAISIDPTLTPAERERLLRTGSLRTPLAEDERLGLWQHAIDQGWVPDDEALRVWRRLDQLVTDITADREAQRAWKQGLPGNHSPAGIDLTDPITGQPVMRDLTYATEREYETALRSLRSRRAAARKRIVVPSAEDLAYRLEAFADSVEAPRPILRSERVGPEDGLPEGFTLDPAEAFVQGQELNGVEGQISWLDVENTIPEQRGFYHATTAMDPVLDMGLKSRLELIGDRMPPRLREALHKAYNVDQLAPADIRITTRDGKEITADHSMIDAVATGRESHFSTWSGEITPGDQIAEVANRLDGTVLYRADPAAGGHVPEGLSATKPDRLVSLTTDWNHAQTIAERFKMASSVARGEVDAEGLLAHFSRWYDDLVGEEEAVNAMADALRIGRPVHDDPAEAYRLLEVALGKRVMSPGGVVDADAAWTAFKDLDLGLHHAGIKYGVADDVFDGAVGFAGSRQGAAAIDPNQVGVVRAAVRHYKPTTIDPGEIDAGLRSAFDALPHRPNAGVAVVHADGRRATFLRWGPVPPRRLHSVGQRAGQLVTAEEWAIQERAAFDLWVAEEVYANGPIQFAESWDGSAPDPLWTMGEKPPAWDGSLPRPGPDKFEMQYDSKDIYVIDPRTTGEPLASTDEDLLRQLRQTVDENGQIIPGYEKRAHEITTRLDHMRQEALNPDPVESIADIPDTAEGITANLEDAIRTRWSQRAGERLRRWGRTFWDPVPTKNKAMSRLVIQMQREEFPRVLTGTGAERVFRDVAGPESNWADFLVHDRALLDGWLRAKSSGTPEEAQAALDALVGHAGGDAARAEMDALYASPLWDTVSSLWALNLKGASEEAFGVHFFDQYRSPLLRSINHPVLGVYPASWAVKTAREWAKFLFDNRSFGVDLRLGMTPAVALANATRAQAVAFAQGTDGDKDWSTYLEDGPLGSTLFVFNLLMPGDWSAIPFPLSRTIREVLRGNVDPGAILARNIDYSGVTRDLRLGAEMWGEWTSLALGPATPVDSRWIESPGSVAGVPIGKPTKPPRWGDEPRR